MKVLSLFDGMACGYEALLRAGIQIEKYYASEIDKYAIQIAMKNHPDIIQVGDVTKLKGEDFKDVDMIIGGSPCQGFSMAGKMLNFNDPRSKLFFEFVRLVKEIKPKYFLLENVKMKKEFQNVISEYMGVQPIEINSALVSAQNRKRLYRTNIPNVSQPEDKEILLKDVLEENVDEKYFLSERQIEMINNWGGRDNPIQLAKTGEEKMGTLTTHTGKLSNGLKLVSVRGGELRIRQATKQGYIVANEGDGVSLAYPNSTTRRGRVTKQKSNTLMASGDSYVVQKVGDRDKNNRGVHTDKSYCLPANPMSDRGQMVVEIPCGTQIGNSKNFGNSFGSQKAYTLRACNPNGVIENIQPPRIRKLTPIECERLQTMPDNYTEGVSDTQRYKMLGNGWTCDVIAHIFSFIKTDNG